MNKLHICLYITLFCFCLTVVLTVVVSKDKYYLSKTEDVTSDYDIPKGLSECRVYKVVNVNDTTKSFYSMQCK